MTEGFGFFHSDGENYDNYDGEVGQDNDDGGLQAANK